MYMACRQITMNITDGEAENEYMHENETKSDEIMS